MNIEPIAFYRELLPEKFGIPRQAGLVPELRGSIVFEPRYRSADAVRGLAGFDYLWLVWGFSAAPFQLIVPGKPLYFNKIRKNPRANPP